LIYIWHGQHKIELHIVISVFGLFLACGMVSQSCMN